MINSKPNALCIGLPKAGTTWLHRSLIKHPDISFPPINEVNYFKVLENNRSITFWTKDHFVSHQLRNKLRNKLLSKYSIFNISRWDINYIFGKKNDSWYRSLFSQDALVSIDCSPVYSELNRQEIESIFSRFPDLKIIFLLRDPIERAWSHVKMRLYNRGVIKTLADPEEVFIKEIIKEAKKYNYIDIYQWWTSYYGKKRVQVYFFEQIVKSPSEILENCFTFLEVPINNIVLNDTRLRKSQNKSKLEGFPIQYKKILIDLLYDQLIEYDKFFNNPNPWATKYLN